MASTVSSRSSATTRSGSKMDALRELSKGLKIEAEFCPTDVADPFDTVQWELRSAQIKDENGKLMFEQKDAEIPASWSQLATNVVVSKYFYGAHEPFLVGIVEALPVKGYGGKTYHHKREDADEDDGALYLVTNVELNSFLQS